MSMMMSKPFSSPNLSSIASALTHFVNFTDLGTDRDLVVHCFDVDVPGWEKLPAAWHRPKYGDIVVNMGQAVQKFMTSTHADSSIVIKSGGKTSTGKHTYQLRSTAITELADRIRKAYSGADKVMRYDSFRADGVTYSSKKVNATHESLRHTLKSDVGYYATADTYLAKMLIGVILHETGHSVFSRFITEKWFAKQNGYEQKIMTMLEELRCERQQIVRIGQGSEIVRLAADLVVNPSAIVDDIKNQLSDDGSVSVPNLALNSILTLGRVDYDVFLKHEVKDLSDLVRDVVGMDRRDEMDRIWNDYSTIREIDPDRMMKCAQDWAELFPSKNDGSSVGSSVAPKIVIVTKGSGEKPEGGEKVEIDDDTVVIYMDDEDDDDSDADDAESDAESTSERGSGEAQDDTSADTASSSSGQDGDDGEGDPKEETLDLPGLVKDFEKKAEEATEKAVENPKDSNHEWDSRGKTPAKEAYNHAVTTSTSRKSTIKTEKPSAEDYMMAKKLSKELENLNVSGRGKFVVASQTPPGRMNSRQAVQRSAERARGQMSTAKPWKRVKHTVDVNPPLTVGVLTDVSGSQSWAEMLSARMAWVLSHAVTSIGGRVAAATFGDEALVTLRPGEHPEKLTIVDADGGTEQFDWAAGTLDTLLNLTTGTGVRLLFVLTDGYMVKNGEMRRTKEWVEAFVKAGVHVIWITPEDDLDYLYHGLPVTPKAASPVIVQDKWEIASNPKPLITEIANAVKKDIARAKRR